MADALLLAMTALSGLFLASDTPYIMVTSLLLSSLFAALSLGALNPSPWLAYILFLVFLGGLLILFTYVSSLDPNPMMTKMSTKIILVFSLPLLLFALVNAAPRHLSPLGDTGGTASPSLFEELFTPLHYPLYLYLFVYLLLTLLYIVALMKIYYAPLRSAT